MDFSKIFEGLDIDKMCKNAIAKAQAEHEKKQEQRKRQAEKSGVFASIIDGLQHILEG